MEVDEHETINWLIKWQCSNDLRKITNTVDDVAN